MVTGDAESIFIDTNILVYARFETAPFHHQARNRLSQLRESGNVLWASRQVLREYLMTVTRIQSFATPLTSAQAADDARQLFSLFQVADETDAVTERLLAILDSITVGGKQVHDANIAATMQVHGISRLLTHNVTDFRRFSDFIQVEPLIAAQSG